VPLSSFLKQPVRNSENCIMSGRFCGKQTFATSGK